MAEYDAEILAAADLIEERGWWNGNSTMKDQPDNTCAYLALRAVIVGEEIDPEGISHLRAASELARRLNLDLFAGGVGALQSWNDRQPDGATVVAAMRATVQ